jgi:hypothetical protein
VIYFDSFIYPRVEDNLAPSSSECSLICGLHSLQLFRLYYYGIIDGRDLRWYTKMLEHCKSLDMNNFLHDFCSYVVNRPRIESRARTTSQQFDPSSGAPPARTFVEFDIFGDDPENVGLQPRANVADPPNWGTSFPYGGVQINEFGTNDGTEFMRDAALSGMDLGSSSRGCRARGRTEPPALNLDGGQECQTTRLQNVVRPSAEGSRESRDTSRRDCGNAPRRDADPNNGGDGDEHDDQDNYWSGASSQGAPRDAPDAGMAQSTPGGRDSDSTEDVESHSHQSPTKPMEVAREELDNQQAVRNAEAHVLAPERESSHDSAERGVAAWNPITSTEPVVERVTDKGKEKVNEKMKELVFIGGVELVDLDDCDVTVKKLQCDSIDSDDDKSPNADGVGISDGLGSCSKTMDSSDELAARSVALEVGEHSEPHTMPTTSIDDALFNAAGKALHPDAVIVKQEAGWFQLRAEKWQRKIAKKLAAQQEKERLAREAEDARNQVALLK